MTRLFSRAAVITVGVALCLTGAQPGNSDQAFIKMAAGSNQAEIQLGKLAAARADRSEVRDFAKQMEKDYTQANLKLLKIIDAQGIDVSRDLEPYQELAKQLSQLRGAEFDRVYVGRMVKDHEEAVARFATEAKEGRNAELKAYAAKHLPLLRERLQHARDLAEESR